MGKTFRRGGSERGYYSPGKSLRDKRQKNATNRTKWEESSYDYGKANQKKRMFNGQLSDDELSGG